MKEDSKELALKYKTKKSLILLAQFKFALLDSAHVVMCLPLPALMVLYAGGILLQINSRN